MLFDVHTSFATGLSRCCKCFRYRLSNIQHTEHHYWNDDEYQYGCERFSTYSCYRSVIVHRANICDHEWKSNDHRHRADNSARHIHHYYRWVLVGPLPAIVPRASFPHLVFIVPSNQTFDPNNNATQESIRVRLNGIINLAFRCAINSSAPNCTQTRQRLKRQACSLGYAVNLISKLTEVRSFDRLIRTSIPIFVHSDTQ